MSGVEEDLHQHLGGMEHSTGNARLREAPG